MATVTDWGTIELTDDADAITEAHILPFGDNPTTGEKTLLWWHTTSPLCGCNPRPHKDLIARYAGVIVYEHFEDPHSQEDAPDGDDS